MRTIAISIAPSARRRAMAERMGWPLSDFIAASRGQGTFITDGDDAYQAMRFVEAAYNAADTGSQVKLA